MKRLILLTSLFFSLSLGTYAFQAIPGDEWIDLYNGKDLTGWRASEHPASFSIQDKVITAVGPRAHLFYEGPALGEGFDNFELRLEVKTFPEANSGIFIHTAFQDEGWPSQGYEVQVNNTHIGAGDYRELKKTGSLYGTRNVYKAPAQDSVWFPMFIRVFKNTVEVWVNGVKTVEYIQPTDATMTKPLSKGTIAFQCHDPGSKVQFRNIYIRQLPINFMPEQQSGSLGSWHLKMMEFQRRDQIPFIDLNPDLEQGAGMEERIKFGYQSGINVGQIVHVQNEGDHQKLVSLYPLFTGTALDDAETSASADYIIGVAPFPTINPGSEAFAKAYYKNIEAFLSDGKFNIWARATALPASMQSDYTNFWSMSKMGPLFELAAKNNVAIEIDHLHKTPSIDLIKLAKEKGCRFSMANISSATDWQDSEYMLEVLEACELKYKDFYVPGW